MGKLTDEKAEDLYRAAEGASQFAHAPYSSFPVGAAVLSESGALFTGCNVENASYGLTICAERVAIGKAISEGEKKLSAIAIYSPKGDLVPCGACRQVIAEFGTEIVVIYSEKGVLVRQQISELLPGPFSKDHL